MRPTIELPDDPALPGLKSIRDAGLSGAIPELSMGASPLELRMHNYVPGSRATIEARAGSRRFAVKLYSDDPAPEAELYQALARVGLAGNSGARVPRLLSWNPELRILVTDWLEGPSASHLVRAGEGARAGELAASWLHEASSRAVDLGPPRDRGHMLYQAGVSVGALGAVDRALGAKARAVARVLVRARVEEAAPRCVHGTLYARHILDLGDGPGVIDWQQFGQGPIELDAGMFLASISRIALRHEPCASEAARAREVFLAGTRGLVNPRTLEWYWAAGLLHLAASGRKGGRKRPVAVEAHEIVEEAAGHAERAAGTPSVEPISAATPRLQIHSVRARPVGLGQETVHSPEAGLGARDAGRNEGRESR